MQNLLSKAAHRLRRHLEPRAVVLMYHRVSEPEVDMWNLAVTPVHFEQHLRVLKQMGTVVSAADVAERAQRRTLPNRSIAITFDDGYLDNYVNARPLLEQYQLPATFFIASGGVELDQELWWDELAAILLLAEQLPPRFLLKVEGNQLEADLTPEQHLTAELRDKHRQWNASDQPPPTLRAALFYRIWQACKPLASAKQQQLLHQLREWTGLLATVRPAYRRVSVKQVRELSCNPLFTIGAHTVTHPSLPSHSAAFQEQELAASKQGLGEIINERVELLAYPYGDCSAETIAIAARLGFAAAFTTEASAIHRGAAGHQLGRFQVNDWNGDEFRRCLKHWLNH